MAKQRKAENAGSSIKKFYIRQFTSLIWMFLAVGIGLTLYQQISWLNNALELSTMALISGLIGIIVPNVSQFSNAGNVLIKGKNPRWNLIVGALATLLILLLFNGVVNLFID